ncbi:TetR family transcriptional regulator [Amycolatopsis thermalba]|uniref:TetR family transcriptional regulator n=1 Tax=Amycolatopsis thermalba TaxID=944492 RepID=A0ABY4P104_9PSEU|nr:MULTISPECIES: TetR family transcriptional regulator [Amycolatopsis]UQS25956.1 TetR family transcriptional regulator [Amycolatopsis thermalba]
MVRMAADDRRQRFIEAAVQVIGEHGVGGATTRRIAAAANAPLASIHYCFATKQDLLVAVFQHVDALILDAVQSTGRHAGMGKAAAAFLVTACEWYTANPSYARAQLDLYQWMLHQGGKWSKIARTAYRSGERKSAGILRSCMLPGEDDDLVEPLVRLVFAIVDGLVLAWFADHDRKRMRASMDLAVKSIELMADRPGAKTAHRAR